MKNKLTTLSALAICGIFFSQCASLTGFQDGRSVGKNNGEITASLNLSQSPDFNKWEEEVDSVTVNIPNFYIPSLEIGGRYGIGERVDLTFRFNTNINIGLGVKAQLVGDRESKVALALGAEAGTFGFITGLWNFQVPVYFSLHPTQKFSWYLTPRYVYQFSSFAGVDSGVNYMGGNTGLLFGERNKFGLDLGYYRLGAGDTSLGLLQIGIGGRFAIGKN